MSPEVLSWKNKGHYVSYGPLGHQVYTLDLGDSHASSDRTLLMLHGFPESSYSYHAVVDGLLSRFDRIVLLDMLGYGLSDKPIVGYTYSLFEQADVVLSVWQQCGIRGGHLLSHDMGDSVATEIIARRENGLLPSTMPDGLMSVTFTNGSMVLSLAKLRITQKMLLSRWGRHMQKLTSFKLFSQQVRSAHGNDNLTARDIQLLWELNTLNQGHHKTYLTIKYLNDRKRFETSRWLPALSSTDLPIHICWGDEDAVARIEMAYYLKEHISPGATFTKMSGLGHFCQLGSPAKWLEYVLAYYDPT